ncbi:hypothetical protein V8C35DRAFT_18183 [Trichoderma chlorosporum]
MERASIIPGRCCYLYALKLVSLLVIVSGFSCRQFFNCSSDWLLIARRAGRERSRFDELTSTSSADPSKYLSEKAKSRHSRYEQVNSVARAIPAEERRHDVNNRRYTVIVTAPMMRWANPKAVGMFVFYFSKP